jgi:hypothetical protein
MAGMREKASKHYIDLIHSYFSDQTEEGQIAKYAKMTECEYWMENMVGISHEDILNIYDHEFWAFHNKGEGNGKKY